MIPEIPFAHDKAAELDGGAEQQRGTGCRAAVRGGGQLHLGSPAGVRRSRGTAAGKQQQPSSSIRSGGDDAFVVVSLACTIEEETDDESWQ